jgi:flagellar protein FlgJ
MSTLPKTNALAYTDFAGLGKLRRGAGNNDPNAIRAVAEQFEALLTRTMLKSMRDAVGKDPMFGSDQQEMYQGLADDQLSIQLSKGKGFGLADMLVRQLQKLGVKGADAALGSSNGAGAATGGARGDITAAPHAGGSSASASKATAAYESIRRASGAQDIGADDNAAKTSFIQEMWPHAEQAGQLLGVDPRHLIAQAALETNWGRNMPQDASGRCSNNLFGIKSTGDWTGATVTAATKEFAGGSVSATAAQFKSYATPAQSFHDYVSLLRTNPRYSAALNTGSDVQAFAGALQRGGYATDPNYAGKIAAVAGKVAQTLAGGAGAVLKLAVASASSHASGGASGE